MNNCLKDLKVLIFKVIFGWWKLVESFHSFKNIWLEDRIYMRIFFENVDFYVLYFPKICYCLNWLCLLISKNKFQDCITKNFIRRMSKWYILATGQLHLAKNPFGVICRYVSWNIEKKKFQSGDGSWKTDNIYLYELYKGHYYLFFKFLTFLEYNYMFTFPHIARILVPGKNSVTRKSRIGTVCTKNSPNPKSHLRART